MTGLTVQLERPEAGFLNLDAEALDAHAEALARAWRAVGAGSGDRVVIYDYGSSPAAYLASAAFCPHLARGAAERTGSQAVCVDGLPDLAGRLAYVLRRYRPRFLFARADVVPLIVGGPTAAGASDRSAKLVVTADGDGPAAVDRGRWEESWPGGVAWMARWDAAAFVAAECRACGALSVPNDLYDARVAPPPAAGAAPADCGLLEVTPRFLSTEAALTEITVRALGPARCCAGSDRFEMR